METCISTSKNSQTKAFSLVELSIVLVILGLLTGGILAGQSLIRAAELRSISNHISRYLTATQAFRDKYFALPGDMANAQSFWGADAVSCPNGGGATGVCNGNGDGLLGNGTFGNTCENQQYWRQLALAGLIEGSYTPKTAASCYGAFTPGQDSPRLPLGNSGLTVSGYLGNITSNAVFPGDVAFIGSYRNVFTAGSPVNAINGAAGSSFLRPEELWNIDNKMDDGRPAMGTVLSIYPGAYSLAAGATGCVTTNVVATSEYSLANRNISCAMMIKTGF